MLVQAQRPRGAAVDGEGMHLKPAAAMGRASGPRGPNELNVSVQHAGQRLVAIFQPRDEGPARREVAAYRLDRELGLGIVPVTVLRTVQGQLGVLQARPSRWVTQAAVQRQSLRVGGWCDAERQFQLVYAFDTLIGNERRTPESLLYDTDAWFVFVTAHDRAFGTTNTLPAFLATRPPSLGAELRRRITALDKPGLAASLGELIDEKGRAAILARRDRLLALPAAADSGAGSGAGTVAGAAGGHAVGHR
jgi:hypothetical protein